MSTSGQTDMASESRKKYLFDNDFSVEKGGMHVPHKPAKDANAEKKAEAPATETPPEVEAVEEAPPPPPTFTQDDLDRVREEGVQAGRDQATRDLAGAMEQRVANTLDTINGQITQLFHVYEQDKEGHSRDAVGVATVIVRKLFPALNMDKAMAEIEHMIVEAMKRTAADHALIIRAPKDMHSEVEAKITQLAALRGRKGTLSVIADETMAIGDVAVEWEGGGMVRDTRLIWQEIDDIVERNLGQKPAFDTPHAPPASPTPSVEAQIQAEPSREQEVVNAAEVGENEPHSVESPKIDPDIDAGAPDSPEHDDERKN